MSVYCLPWKNLPADIACKCAERTCGKSDLSCWNYDWSHGSHLFYLTKQDMCIHHKVRSRKTDSTGKPSDSIWYPTPHLIWWFREVSNLLSEVFKCLQCLEIWWTYWSPIWSTFYWYLLSFWFAFWHLCILMSNVREIKQLFDVIYDIYLLN